MRFLRDTIPGVHLADRGGMGGGANGSNMLSTGDGYSSTNSEPTLETATPIEGSSVHAVNIPGIDKLEPGFEAFLDGTQRVEIEAYLPNGVQVLSATTAAAIRIRSNRRMITWGHQPPLVHRGIYVPLRYCPGFPAVAPNGLEIVDSAETDANGKFPIRHPAALVASALDKIKKKRETLESRLAEIWCAHHNAPLFIDGSIQGSDMVATSPCVVGVIKSHTTIHVSDKELDILYNLRRGQRTSAVRIAPRSRKGVATWYVRLRDNKGRDPLFGLVRIEAAETPDITDRADKISKWVLAEGSPLALPDNRWDKMIYGVRDCEEYLRAIS